ncbi:MAG TPA: hypothetical protein VM554_10740 [Acidisarcina sp.]|nr:hypothetical protein [Acidisarcina sp.]
MQKFALFCALLSASTSILAQSSSRPVSEVNLVTPKPGMAAQFEAGRKAHSAFHAAQKDTWSIYVWQVLTGERAGSYVMVSPGHHWSDFDAREAFNKLDQADVAKNILPYAASSSRSYFAYREDLSRSKPPATPPMLHTNTYYSVNPEHFNDFIDAVKKINAALEKTNYPTKPSRWYSLANGGEVPAFVLIVDRASWADMEPPEKPMEDALKEAYGDSGPQVLDQLRRSCRSIYTEMSVYRADLSYVPK